MKYMILTYASQQDYDAMGGKPGGESTWSAEDFAAMGAFMESFTRDLMDSGELVETRVSLYRSDLATEAIRLARMVYQLLPDETEVAGLLALMLLTDARRPARTGPTGELIPMAEQDRSLWNLDSIAEGVALITDALPRGAVGPYQLQAAIAAIHDEAPREEETDWPQIVALYELLLQVADNPIVALNHAVAVGMARGPQTGLDLLDQLQTEERIAEDHRFHAARAHLLEVAGDRVGARDAYVAAAQRATNLPQQRHLHTRAARITDDQ